MSNMAVWQSYMLFCESFRYEEMLGNVGIARDEWKMCVSIGNRAGLNGPREELVLHKHTLHQF